MMFGVPGVFASIASGTALILAEPDIVVAICPAKAQEPFNRQLFLYRENGKLARRVTYDSSGLLRRTTFASGRGNQPAFPGDQWLRNIQKKKTHPLFGFSFCP